MSPYIRVTDRSIGSSQYNFGQLLAFDNTPTEYVEAEGWMGSRFGLGAGGLEKAITLETTEASSNGPAAFGRTVFASANNPSSTEPFNHHIKVFRGPQDDIELADLLFVGYKKQAVEFQIPASQVQDETRVNQSDCIRGA
jgi:hypothetical protein